MKQSPSQQELTKHGSYHVHAALALCVYDKKYLGKYLIYFTDISLKFVDHLRKIQGTPTKQMFIGVAKDQIGDVIPMSMVISVFTMVDEFGTMTDEDILKHAKSVETNLSETTKLDKALRNLEESRKLLISGLKTEAQAALRNLLSSSIFQSAGRQLSTRHLMLQVFTEGHGFPSGIKQIDDDTGGWLQGNMCAIAGDSGSQKTMVSIWMMIKALMANPKHKALYFEKEMPIVDISRRLISHLLNVDGKELIKMTNKPGSHHDDLQNLANNIKEIMDDNTNPVANALSRLIPIERDAFRHAHDMWELVENYKADMWVLDFATLLEPASGTIDDDSMRKEFVTLKAMLESTNAFGVVLSQLKQSNGVDARSNKIPLIGDMEWGKHLRQFSSWVYSIFYPGYYEYEKADPNWFYLVSRKTRHGSPMTIPLLSYPQYCSFEEPNEMTKYNMMEYIHAYNKASTNKRF